MCLLAFIGCTLGAGMCVVAVALHPPAGVMPLVLILCIGGPVVGTWELPRALAVLHRHYLGGQARAVAHFRKSLALLPEVEHPLDG